MNYKVLVYCATFNQSNFIEQTLDGFVSQQTNFPFVCCIMDDCSTDGERDVLEKYMQNHFDFAMASESYIVEKDYAKVLFARHKKNKNCFFSVLLLNFNHFSKKKSKREYLTAWSDGTPYEAMCEGDDYWTDPLKLQKQVSFLEKNPDYTMCFHRAKIIKEAPELRCGLVCDNLETREYFPDEILSNWIVPTASVVLRKECLDYPIKGENRILNGDIFIVMKCASMGKVYGMSDCMSVYRVQKGGVTYNKAGLNNRALRYPEHYECLIENFPGIASQTLEKLLSESYFYRALVQDSLSKKINDCKKSLKINKKAFFLVLKRHIAVQMKIRGKTLFPSLYDKWKSANGKNKCK